MECFKNYYISDNTFELCKKINDKRLYISTLYSLCHNNIIYFNNNIIKTLLICIYEQYRYENVHIFIYSKYKSIKYQFYNVLHLIKKLKIKGISFYLNNTNINTKNNIIVSDYNIQYDNNTINNKNNNKNNNTILKRYYIIYKEILYRPFLFTNNHSNYIICNNNYTLDYKLYIIDRFYHYNTIYKSIICVNDIITAELVCIFLKKMDYTCLILTRDNISLIDSNSNHRVFILYDHNIINIYSIQVNFLFYIDPPLFIDTYIWRQQYLFNHTVCISFLNTYNIHLLKELNNYGIQFREIYF